jgi:hypothetical protein
VEVGDQGIDDAEGEARDDGAGGRPLGGHDGSVGVRRRLEGPDGSRSHGDDAATAVASAAHGGGGDLGHHEGLGLDAVVLDLLGLDRAEGPRPDVKEHLGALDAP